MTTDFEKQITEVKVRLSLIREVRMLRKALQDIADSFEIAFAIRIRAAELRIQNLARIADDRAGVNLPQLDVNGIG